MKVSAITRSKHRNGMVLSCFCITAMALFVTCGSKSEGQSSNQKNKCVETLPDCDKGPVCVGRYVRTCSEDKKHYIYQYCYGQTCQNGACNTAACLEPGKSECTGPDSLTKCLETMTQKAPLTCNESKTCVAGVCVPTSCNVGEKMCGWKAVLTCNDDKSSWTVEQCEDDEFCDPDTVVCVAQDKFCLDNPLGAYCLDLSTSMQCDYLGRAVPFQCEGDEVCIEGFCQKRACGIVYEKPESSDLADTADVLSDGADAEIGELILPETTIPDDLPPPDVPGPEPPKKAWVTINGGQFEMEKIKFTSNKKANYVWKDKDLQINMAKGVFVLEIHLANIEEGVVGSFSSEEPGSVNIWIWFNDGTTDQTQIQWKYQSSAYEVTLDEFGPVGGRVKGTFAGILEDQTGGPSLELIDGYFDIPRVQ